MPCQVCQTLVGFCILWPGADPGWKDEGMHATISHFQNVFHVYNFAVFSNLFDRDYALGRHNRTCANKMHHTEFGEAFTNRVKKFA